MGEGLHDGLWHVHVAAVLDNFLVHQLRDLGGRVVLGAVELERLTDGAVIVQHSLEGSADINGLCKLSARLKS